MSLKILLVDDHALFRDGLRYVLQQLPEEVEIMEAGNFQDGLKLATQHPELDLALLDLNMPGSEGALSIRYFNQHYPHIPVVVVSGEEGRDHMEKVMDYGAMGFIGKGSTAAVMLGALNLILSGGVYIPAEMLHRHNMLADKLTDDDEPRIVDRRRNRANEFNLTIRQTQVLRYMAAGLSNREIAEAVSLAEGTIKIHIAAIYQIMRVSKRIEAIRLAENCGLLPPPHD